MAKPSDKVHNNGAVTSDLDDPDPDLMAKLGILLGGQHVKTTTHIHPVLHNTTELKKKSTISPASTLSDKGIGM